MYPPSASLSNGHAEAQRHGLETVGRRVDDFDRCRLECLPSVQVEGRIREERIDWGVALVVAPQVNVQCLCFAEDPGDRGNEFWPSTTRGLAAWACCPSCLPAV